MKNTCICFSILLFLMSCTSEYDIMQESFPAPEEPTVSPGAVCVCLSSEVADTISNTYGFQRLFPDAGEFEQRHREAGLHRWFVAVEGTKADISCLPGVEYVEDTPGIETCGVAGIPFNDPLAKTKQWHLYNDGTLSPEFNMGADINVVPVWKNYTTGSKDVIVAVIDSGSDASHPDLNQAIIPDGKDGSRNFIYDYSSTPYVTYPERHGTHTASIIGAVNNNGIGVCGIAGGSNGKGGVRILSCQALATGHSGNPANALVWAADHGAVIASNSWNYEYSSESSVPSTTPASIRTAIDYFTKNAGFNSNGEQTGPMAGGVVFFSAGNKQWAKSQPSMYDGVLAVGATGPCGEITSYTNFGPWVDLCAPGGNSSGYSSTLSMIYGCVTGGGYYQMQGTSQACPMASGVAALLVSYFGGPGFTNEMLKEKLLGGAGERIGGNKPIGPRLDAYGAFTFTKELPPQVTEFTVTVKKQDIQVNWKVQEHDGMAVNSYYVVVGKDEEQVKSFDPLNIPGELLTKEMKTSSKKIGAECNVTFKNLDNHAEYYCTLVSIGRNGKNSTPALVQKVYINLNNAPEITAETTGPVTVPYDGQASILCRYSDPDGDPLTTDTDPGSSAAEWTKPEDGVLQLNISGSDLLAGSYTATATVSDPYGGSAEVHISYILTGNSQPKLIQNISDFTIAAGRNTDFRLEEYFSDPDEDHLEYNAVSSSDRIQASVNGSLLTISGSGNGSASVKVTASDPGGKTAQMEFNVRVQDTEVGIYPNPVHDKLFISTVEPGTAVVTIKNSYGKQIFSKSVEENPLTPYYVDMSKCANGTYTISVSFKGKDTVKQIVKY